MQIGQYNVSIHPKNKSAADEYLHQNNTFIEGRAGNEYTIRVQNNSATKVKAIISVDGLSIQDGKPASERSPGYIVNPYTNITIPGWSLDYKSVGEFIFAKKSKSYASQSYNDTNNVGVIGFMIFKEKQQLQFAKSELNGVWNSLNTRSCSPFGSNVVTSSCSNVTNAIGTGVGNTVNFNVSEVQFTSEDNPDAIFAIYYDSAKNLERMGIILKKNITASPNPFPLSNSYGIRR